MVGLRRMRMEMCSVLKKARGMEAVFLVFREAKSHNLKGSLHGKSEMTGVPKPHARPSRDSDATIEQ